jgi:hypothetical protein
MAPIRDRGNRGFALALVVFLLFAAAVAGATGYQIVSSEASLAEGNESQDEALAVANAGMQRYVGEHIGIPGSSTYAVGDGSVTVTPKKMAKLNDSTDLYLLTAVGSVSDPRYPTSPATRTVRQYANLNRRPVKGRATFMSVQSTINIANPGGEVDGTVHYNVSAAADCPANDTNNLNATAGVASPGTSTGGPNPPIGSPGFVSLGTIAGVISAAGVRWSVLEDPTFPVPYDGSWPNFSSIPSDSFPVIRVNGNYTLDRNGRGALIVTGNFSTAGDWDWEGIILVGGAATGSYSGGSGGGNTVKGMIVSGLDGTTFGGAQALTRFQARWFPCNVRKANLALAYLSPVSRSLWTY